MILSNLNDYCYIFEPNILKVTCENTSDPTKEVVLTANGITLKRNCINSVCYFDMSVIFESYFNNLKFEFNYSDVVDDPFFATCLFDLDSASEDLIVEQPVKLRWGAYQFDEIKSSADFSFPFWVGMPLIVNSQEKYSEWACSASGGSGGEGVKTVPVTETNSFYFQSDDGQKITYNPITCPTGHYFHWVDAHGQIWHYMFYASRERQTATEIKSGESVVYYPLSLTDSQQGNNKILSKSKQRTFNCFQSVDESIYPIVQSILSSPIVRYWINSKWVGVQIKDNTVSPEKRGFVDIEFTVELPNDFIQTR